MPLQCFVLSTMLKPLHFSNNWTSYNWTCSEFTQGFYNRTIRIAFSPLSNKVVSSTRDYSPSVVILWAHTWTTYKLYFMGFPDSFSMIYFLAHWPVSYVVLHFITIPGIQHITTNILCSYISPRKCLRFGIL